MARFRKKPIEFNAVQWNGEDCEYDEIERLAANGPCTISLADGDLYIQTLEGMMHAEFGDWVCQGVEGEVYPCKPDIFRSITDPVAPPPS